uniref:Rx_N domain-containing protein n=1 Tax=Heterorhabditis bacteriophora TaxID=37862 RepID=A0A1I7XPS9_HETBA
MIVNLVSDFSADAIGLRECADDLLDELRKEMRRVLSELADTVCTDLEDCLELRQRGCIARRPSAETIENLQEMRRGMRRAVGLLCGAERSTA